MHNNKKLKIIEVNLNSLVSLHRRHNLELFLKEHKPDILLVCETKLNSTHKVIFKNYTFIRNDRRNSMGGGTGILIKNEINFNKLNCDIDTGKLEYTAISIKLSNTKNINIFSVYNPPNETLNPHHLNNIIKISKNTEFILGGDLNCRHISWFNSSNNPSGNSLFNWYTKESPNLQISLVHSIEPTYVNKNTSSILDLFIISNNIQITFSNRCPGYLETHDYESDHRAVEIKINTIHSVVYNDPIKIPNYRQANWKEINAQIDQNLNQIDLPSERNITSIEIDNFINQFNSIVTNAVDTHTPQITINNSSIIPLPKTTTDLILKKNNLRRKLFRNRFNNNNNQLRSTINCLKKIIKEQIYIHINKYWQQKISKIKMDNQTFKTIKNITTNRSIQMFPDLNQTTSKNNTQTTITITDNKEKANLLGQHFGNVHRQNTNLGDTQFSNNINNRIDRLYQNNHAPLIIFNSTKSADTNINSHHPFPESYIDPPSEEQQPNTSLPGHITLLRNNQINLNFTNTEMVKLIIKSRNNKKSTGPDNINNTILKKLSSKSLKLISILFNHIFNIGYFPTEWKLATVIPIPKKGNTMDPKNYRPISLISCISKIYEKFINEKLREHCEENNVIPNTQFGFRPNHSTTHALLKFSEDLAVNLNNKTPVTALSLDCEKAFDTVWKNALIYKMKYLFGFHDHLYKIIFHYLSNRTFRVRIDNTLSNTYQIEAGVPQGSILASILFSIYIADIPTPTNNKTKIIHYADDILIYTASRRQTKAEKDINEYLTILQNYLNKWKVKLNPDKCEAIHINGKRNNIILNIHINNQLIHTHKNIKYLGVIFSTDFQFFRHIDYITNKTTKAYHAIKKILIPTKQLDIKIKTIIYKQLLRPILSYAFPIWFNISSNQMERLRKKERRYLRACIDARRERGTFKYISNIKLYNKAAIERIDQFLIKQALKFINNLELTQNPIITNCGQFEIEYLDSIQNKFKPPHMLLRLKNSNHLYDTNGKLIYYHRRDTNQPLINNTPVYNTAQRINQT